MQKKVSLPLKTCSKINDTFSSNFLSRYCPHVYCVSSSVLVIGGINSFGSGEGLLVVEQTLHDGLLLKPLEC